MSKTIDYGQKICDQLLPASRLVVKNKAKHTSGNYQYTGAKINCSVFASYILQKAGMLAKGKRIYHTEASHKKKTLYDIVRGRTNVKNMTWHLTSKDGKGVTYSKLPSKYKKKGCVYIYASSVAIRDEAGRLYGCHSSGKTYTSLAMIRHIASKKEYEFTSPILAVGVPKTITVKDETDIAKEVIAGKWGTGDERKKKLTEAGWNYDKVQDKVNDILKEK